MSLKPMNDFVFVRKKQVDKFSESGLFLGRSDYDTGEVVAVGPGKRKKNGDFDTMWGLAPGMEIAFSPNGNHKQRVDGEELFVIRRDSVIGIVEPEAA